MHETIDRVDLGEKLARSYLNYSLSVIADRALPAAKDGLKPVARRILYAMHEMGLKKSSAHKKCARIVGEVMGKFHPHGDSAIYGALVRLAQDFSLLHPLIDGQGAFGSIDDGAAAMRYTEARLEEISELLLQDLEFETVKFVDNFDGTLKEPSVLPARFPQLLVNGSAGIAVGMATNIPAHNLEEIIDATIYLMENENAKITDLLKFVKGPDFPSGGLLQFVTPIEELYSTGRGEITARAKIESLDVKRRNGIQITELPYQASKEKILKQIYFLVKEKKIEGVMDVRDESDREGMNITIEFSRKLDVEDVIRKLYRSTACEESFSCNFLALFDNNPVQFNLKQYLQTFIDFRKETATKYFTFKLNQREKRKNILEGYKKIIDDIENVIRIIRKQENYDELKATLMKKYDLNEEQVVHILETKLSKLSKLEENRVDEEIKQLKDEIKEIKEILASKKLLQEYIKDDLEEIKSKYGKRRCSKIVR
jgi:DNA gyrase subunit A